MNINELDNSTDLNKLFSIFPPSIEQVLQKHSQRDAVLEIVLDLGKRAEARFLNKTQYISEKNISWQDLDYTVQRIGKFNDDNRAGIEKTLHRISCICNREGLIIGLTCRVGRSVSGLISLIRDYLKYEKSFLILGKPGVGKTTIIREIARILSDELNKRVVIIDTSNEIAGASNIPHSSLGRARRMQVKKSKLQHDIMLEAVENHMPEIIIIDEISTELEVLASRTIAERGVQLIGTVHGTTLKNLVQNPILVELVGGIQHVTLSDEEAKRRGSQKGILERKTNSSFNIAIEISERNFWTIYPEIDRSVDLILKNKENFGQIRNRTLFNSLTIQISEDNNNYNSFYKEKILKSFNLNWKKNLDPNLLNFKIFNQLTKKEKLNFKKLTCNTFNEDEKINIFCFGFSSNYFELINLSNYLDYRLTENFTKADIIVTNKYYLESNPHTQKFFTISKKYVYAFKCISLQEILNFLEILLYLTLIKVKAKIKKF